MTDPDIVFARFVDANPVTDGADLADVYGRPDVAGILSGPTATRGRLWPTSPSPYRWAWIAAMAFLSVLAVVGLFLLQPEQRASQLATEPPSSDEVLGQEAVSAVEAWFEAMNAGEIDRVMALSGPTVTGEADRRLHEWEAGLAAEGMAVEIRGCGVVSAVGSMARVECEVRLSDPVAVELGVADLVAPFDYSDGLITWRPYTGGDIGAVNDAYSSYLQLFHASEYEARCSPASYAPGTVVQDRRLALTGECAELAAPLAADIAKWISDGRPEPQE